MTVTRQRKELSQKRANIIDRRVLGKTFNYKIDKRRLELCHKVSSNTFS